MRKTRYWFCKYCGNVYHRFKKAASKMCGRCGKACRKTRTYPKRARVIKERRHRKTVRASRDRARLSKRHSRVRTTYGSVLKISKETKKAWKTFLTAKQRRSFESRGQKFLEALGADLWSCPHQKGQRLWSGRECGCSGGGVTGEPHLSIDDGLDCLGRYGRGFYRTRDGHKYTFYIKVRWDQKSRSSTLLHEVIHWADDLGQVRGWDFGSHTRAFYFRLEDLASRLRFELEDNKVD